MLTRWSNSSRASRTFLAAAFSALVLAGCSSGLTSTSWPGISADEKVAYLAFNQAVHAIDLQDGRELWMYPAEPDRALMMFAPPALAPEDQVIVGGFNSKVFALLKTDQTVAWESDVPGGRIIGAPVVTGDLVLVPSADGSLYALNVYSGAQAWAFRARQDLWASPAVDGDAIYLTSLDHHVYALSLESGELRWEKDLSGAIPDAPAVAEDVLLVGTLGNALFALEKRTGEVLWEIEAKDWVWGTPAVGDGVAYYADLSGAVSAVRIADHTAVWTRSIGGKIVASPVLAEDVVYVVTEAGSLSALAAEDGSTLWQDKPGGRLLSDPIRVGNALLVSSLGSDSLLSAYDVQSGERIWSYQPAEKEG